MALFALKAYFTALPVADYLILLPETNIRVLVQEQQVRYNSILTQLGIPL
jgi:hypothetical protein